MTRVPEPGPDVSCSPDALRCRFPAWKIGFDERLWIWFAEKRAGTALHYVAGHTPSDLGASLERIEAKAAMPKNVGAKGSGSNQHEVRSHDETAPRWVTSASGPDFRQVTP